MMQDFIAQKILVMTDIHLLGAGQKLLSGLIPMRDFVRLWRTLACTPPRCGAIGFNRGFNRYGQA